MLTIIRSLYEKVCRTKRKTLFSVMNVSKNNFFNIETMLSVFDTYFNFILSYYSEVWGFHSAHGIEQVHLHFCKRLLGVRKGTCNELIYNELGRFPLKTITKLRLFKYWIKLRSTSNVIIKGVYEDLVHNNGKWLLNIRQEMNTLGLNYILNLSYVNKRVYCTIKERMLDISIKLQQLLKDFFINIYYFNLNFKRI